MLTLLAFVVAVEAVMTLVLMSGLPTLYTLPRAGLDLLKTSRGLAISRTLFGASALMLASAITSIQKTQKRIRRFGAAATPADHDALSTLFLESSLLGYCILLGIVIMRLHSYLREIEVLKLNMETLKKQAKASQTEFFRLQNEQKVQTPVVTDDVKSAKEIKSLKDIIADLRVKLEELQIDSQNKDKELKAAETNSQALKKQAEGFLLEYDRLLEENENLRSQISAFDRKYYKSDTKKSL